MRKLEWTGCFIGELIGAQIYMLKRLESFPEKKDDNTFRLLYCIDRDHLPVYL